MGFYQAQKIEKLEARIAELEALLSDVNTGYAECIATREDYRARIAALEARLNYIEAHVLGLVKTHSQFAAAAEGSWSGKKQRVRAAEASQILAFIRKERAAMEGKDAQQP